MDTESATAIGTVARLGDRLDELVRLMRKGEEWGGTGDPEKLSWDPAGNPPTAEYAYDGIFVSVGVFNLSAGVIRVSLTPNGARQAGNELLTLSARGFIVLPYRGVTVSIGGAAAGQALVVPCEIPQPLNAGTF
jgi:hypothetical protein